MKLTNNYLLALRHRLGVERLPDYAERKMRRQHDAEIAQLLPLLGPLFGLAVICFGVWDALIDPAHSHLTLAVRLVLVLAGAAAYRENALALSVTQRCNLIYLTHAGAIIVSSFLLDQGMLYGMGAIASTACVAAVVTLRVRTLLLALSPPFLLFVLLGLWRLPAFALISGVMLYLFSIALAVAIMLTIRYFYQRAFVLEQRLLHLTRHDSLTGAANRRYLEEMAEREIALARRHQHPLAVAMLDIDHFKLVNDRYGHDVGDQVLQILVQTCQRALREIDHFGRYGGEEFVCILPETDPDEAQRCAERLRKAVAALRVGNAAGPLEFTVSIGVAMFRPHHADFAAVLKEADGAMYEAKRTGRNRVVLAGAASADAAHPLSII